jgi:hypothetical protein
MAIAPEITVPKVICKKEDNVGRAGYRLLILGTCGKRQDQRYAQQQWKEASVYRYREQPIIVVNWQHL